MRQAWYYMLLRERSVNLNGGLGHKTEGRGAVARELQLGLVFYEGTKPANLLFQGVTFLHVILQK